MRGIIDAVGTVACVLTNERYADILALPSLSIIKGDKCILVVGDIDDSLVEKAAEMNVLYGTIYYISDLLLYK